MLNANEEPYQITEEDHQLAKTFNVEMKYFEPHPGIDVEKYDPSMQTLAKRMKYATAHTLHDVLKRAAEKGDSGGIGFAMGVKIAHEVAPGLLEIHAQTCKLMLDAHKMVYDVEQNATKAATIAMQAVPQFAFAHTLTLILSPPFPAGPVVQADTLGRMLKLIPDDVMKLIIALEALGGMREKG